MRTLTEEELAELYYLVGRLIGFRTRIGEDVDQVVYYDQYRVTIETVDARKD